MLVNNKYGCMAAGMVARDPEMKIFNSGKNKLKFSILYGNSEELNDNGRPKGLFIDVDVWAEYGTACTWLKKGDRVFVTGRVESREYEGKTYRTLVADGVFPDAPAVSRFCVGGAAVSRPPVEDAFADITGDEEDLPF